MIFAVFDVLLAVNMSINYSFFYIYLLISTIRISDISNSIIDRLSAIRIVDISNWIADITIRISDINNLHELVISLIRIIDISNSN